MNISAGPLGYTKLRRVVDVLQDVLFIILLLLVFCLNNTYIYIYTASQECHCGTISRWFSDPGPPNPSSSRSGSSFIRLA